MKLALLSTLLAAAGFTEAQPPKIAIAQVNRAVCNYLAGIVPGPCHQAVTVAVKSDDLSSEAFKVTLTYRDAKGNIRTDTRVALPSKDAASMSATVTYLLEDITVISAVVTPLVADGQSAKYPQD